MEYKEYGIEKSHKLRKRLLFRRRNIHAHLDSALHGRPAADLGKTACGSKRRIAVFAAVKLFELHRMSIGKAAQFCGMGKLRFMFELGRLRVPVMNLDDDQIADELRDD